MMVDRVACFLQGSLGSWCFYSGVLKYFTNAEYYPVAGIPYLAKDIPFVSKGTEKKSTIPQVSYSFTFQMSFSNNIQNPFT